MLVLHFIAMCLITKLVNFQQDGSLEEHLSCFINDAPVIKSLLCSCRVSESIYGIAEISRRTFISSLNIKYIAALSLKLSFLFVFRVRNQREAVEKCEKRGTASAKNTYILHFVLFFIRYSLPSKHNHSFAVVFSPQGINCHLPNFSYSVTSHDRKFFQFWIWLISVK